jgi:hypothetical protein
MAYPTISAPYGLKPINLIGGQVFAGATRQRRIASGYATSIFYGDAVKLTTTGTIVLANETSTAPATGFAGVFLGCSYVNAQGQVIFAQYYPASTTAPTGTFITAYIGDDPDQLFKVVSVSGTTVVSGIEYAAIGNNAALVQNSGVTATGDSRVAMLDNTDVTATLPLRIVDVVPDTAYVSGGTTLYPEVIVKFNAPSIDTNGVTNGGHMYLNPLGIA